MAEKNKEITDVIGRRLREAADAERTGQLPESIQAGLERLNAIGIGSKADRDGADRGRPVEQATGSAAALCLTAAGRRP